VKLYFSADLHLSHSNILKYCNRPWLKKGDLTKHGSWKTPELAKKRVRQMNNDLVKNFNSVIKADDFVIHNGDFCFKNSVGGKLGEGELDKSYDHIKKFNGIWTFVAGNHDKNNSLKTKIASLIIKFGNLDYFVVHDPKDLNPNYAVNLVGHVHNSWKIKEVIIKNRTILLYNVGVDVHNFYPVSMDKIVAEIQKWKKINGKKEKTRLS